jgi:predicted nucleic acid-binding Zn ribbon protein
MLGILCGSTIEEERTICCRNCLLMEDDNKEAEEHLFLQYVTHFRVHQIQGQARILPISK